MNVEKLYKVSTLIVGDIKTNKIQELFTDFITKLNQVVSNPQATQYQTAFADSQTKLFTALENCQVNNLGLNNLQILNEICKKPLLGNMLKENLNNILIGKNMAIAPAQAQSELKPVHTDFTKFYNNLTKTNEIFSDFGLGLEESQDNMVSIVFPKNIINGDFKAFEKDIKDFRGFLDRIQEISGDNTKYQIDKISSSDFCFYILCGIEFAKYLSEAINSILDMFLKVGQIRESLQNLKNLEVPSDTTKPITEYEHKYMLETIKQITQQLLNHSFGDEARKKELKTLLNKDLNVIMRKIDTGYQMTVSIKETDKETSEEYAENTGDAQQQKELLEQVKKLNVNAEKVFSLAQQGKILGLPPFESNKDDNDKNSAEKP